MLRLCVCVGRDPEVEREVVAELPPIVEGDVLWLSPPTADPELIQQREGVPSPSEGAIAVLLRHSQLSNFGRLSVHFENCVVKAQGAGMVTLKTGGRDIVLVKSTGQLTPRHRENWLCQRNKRSFDPIEKRGMLRLNPISHLHVPSDRESSLVEVVDRGLTLCLRQSLPGWRETDTSGRETDTLHPLLIHLEDTVVRERRIASVA